MASMKIKVPEPKHPEPDSRPALHPMLPRYDFITALVGPTGSGKSVVMWNMLHNTDMLGGKFHVVIIVSPTLFTDPVWKELADGTVKLPKLENGKRPRLGISTTYDQDKLDKLFADQKSFVEEGHSRAPSLLLILDDCGPELKRHDIIARNASVLRHYKMMVLLRVQRVIQLPPPLRSQIRTWFLFATALSSGNKHEIDTLHQIVAPLTWTRTTSSPSGEQRWLIRRTTSWSSTLVTRRRLASGNALTATSPSTTNKISSPTQSTAMGWFDFAKKALSFATDIGKKVGKGLDIGKQVVNTINQHAGTVSNIARPAELNKVIDGIDKAHSVSQRVGGFIDKGQGVLSKGQGLLGRAQQLADNFSPQPA